MKASDALRFVERHGVVLEAGHGPVVNLVDAIAGRALGGNWWASPRGKTLFRATREVRDSPDVLTCRLLDGKITFVHRRLWAALARLAPLLPAERLAQVQELHTKKGHRTVEKKFPRWVPPEIRIEARRLTDEAALAALGKILGLAAPALKPDPPRRRAAR